MLPGDKIKLLSAHQRFIVGPTFKIYNKNYFKFKNNENKYYLHFNINFNIIQTKLLFHYLSHIKIIKINRRHSHKTVQHYSIQFNLYEHSLENIIVNSCVMR